MQTFMIQRMNPRDFGHPLTFSLLPAAGQNVHLSSKISSGSIDQNFVQTFTEDELSSSDTMRFSFVVLSEM